ncbi:MAG: hypothetical protein Q8Q30_02675 [Candidatus Woesebacteria bacterium]|nr:hypothetical protein [Candidatus Woesebacteria bacterium]
MSLTQYTDRFAPSTRERCFECSAHGNTYVGQIPIPECKIAALEIRQKPVLLTKKMTDAAKIDTGKIPEDCPNEYGSTRKIK